MEAKVFYQDFEKNCGCFNDEDLVFSPESALLVWVFDISSDLSRTEICNDIWAKMNQLDIPIGHPKRGLFREIGHTSMSVGDYIVFEDGEVRIAAPYGWKTPELKITII